MKKKISPKFHFLTKIEIKRPHGAGGGGKSGLQVTAAPGDRDDRRGFLGFEIFDFGIFWG